MTEMFDRQRLDVDLVQDSPVDECVLAIDQFDHWGAAFIFSVDETGEWCAECLRALRQNDGRWADMGTNGTHGTEWPIPWSPPPDEWMGGGPLLLLLTGGQSVDTATAENQMLQAVVGFAGPSVENIQIVQGDLRRQITVSSQVGAFVVMSVGVGPIELQAFNSMGRKVGSARQIL
ncbi:MAG: hypothetical protein ACLQRH_11000 [Acidimicrobiales bacterium]